MLFLLLWMQVWPGGDVAFGRMARTHLSRASVRAIHKYGPSVNHLARERYGISGQQLLARLDSLESHDNPNATSPVGAHGRTQFMPEVRDAFLKAFGIDAYGSADEAFHAASLHLRGALGHGKGLEGYNPGDPNYPSQVLAQRTDLGAVSRKLGLKRGGGGGMTAATHNTLAGYGLSPLESTVGPGMSPQDLMASLGLDRPQVPVSAPPVPQGLDARARLPMPAATQLPDSSGGPAPKRAIDDLLARASALTPTTGLPDVTQQQVGGQTQAGGGGATGVRGGHVVVRPGANRPGTHMRPEVRHFLRGVSALVGETLTIGTGTNHDRLTINGTVSDHFDGRGADVPATGAKLIRLGQAALIRAGMNPRKARKQHGGLYNLQVGGRRIQIIFNTNGPGVGDHTTHLHVGFSA